MTWAKYRIGDAHKLISLETRKIDAIVTDPPYQIMTEGSGFAKLRQPHFDGLREIGSNPDFSIGDFLPSLEKICNPMVLFTFASKTDIRLLINWATEKGYSWDILTWHKKNPMPMTNNHHLRDTEFIFYSRARGGYFPPKGSYHILKTYWVEDSQLRHIGRGDTFKPDIIHPCKKPLSILRDLVRVATPEGGTILDPFAGSGTTLKASLIHNRNAIGYEIDPKWKPLLEASCNPPRIDLYSHNIDEETEEILATESELTGIVNAGDESGGK